MSAIKFLQLTDRTQPLPKIFGSPIIEPMFPDMKKKQRNVGSIRTFLEIGKIGEITKFIEKAPTYLPFVVAALIDTNDTVSFNAEWCVRRLACSSDKNLKIVLKSCLLDFLNSPWIKQGSVAGNQKATELATEMRELYYFISN